MSPGGTVAEDFVMSSGLRSRLLGHLARNPMTVTELASVESKHLSHVSRALSELRSQGLVEPVSRIARERKYRVTHEGLALYATFLKNAR